MKKKTILLAFLILACTKYEEITIKKTKKEQPVTPSIRVEVIEKYTYKGGEFQDPFSDFSKTSLYVASPQTYAISPDIDSLRIKGVLKDKRSILILFDSPTGSYIVDNEKIYDINMRPINDIEISLPDENTIILTKGEIERVFDISAWGVGGVKK